MIQIRRFDEKDQKAVKGLITKIMTEEFHQEASIYPTEDLEDIQGSYGGLGEAFFVATEGAQVIGTAAIKKEDDRIALLRRLFVAPPFRNRRIGLELIDRALQFCEEVGYQEIIFKTTSQMKGAIEICQRRGFVPRAKLGMGAVELLKFSLSLRDGKKARA